MKILIIEDEYNLADAISCVLETKNYIVKIETDGLNGLEEALTNTYDLIILDVMLPSKNGFEILKELKTEKVDSKVLMLTAKSSIEDKMLGFNSGADDYLTKPFHMEELVARVDIQLRKAKIIEKNILQFGDIALDTKSMELINKKNNMRVKVIGKEFQLLELLMNNVNQIMEKEQLFVKIWGYDTDCDINTLEAYISFIRKKLKLIESESNLKAIRNLGYVFEIKDIKIHE